MKNYIKASVLILLIALIAQSCSRKKDTLSELENQNNIQSEYAPDEAGANPKGNSPTPCD